MNKSGIGAGVHLVGILRSDAPTAQKVSATIDAFERADDADRFDLLMEVSREAITLIGVAKAMGGAA